MRDVSSIMQLETYLLFDSPLLISSSSSSSSSQSSSSSSWFLFLLPLLPLLIPLLVFLFWYIHPLPYYKTEKHSPKHYLVEYNINNTYLFLSGVVLCWTLWSLSNFPSLVLFFPTWTNKKDQLNMIGKHKIQRIQ